jgi:hypothetical protein
MKIILSRKGFDQGSGGGPSPIFPDGTMVSLPIPAGRRGRRYRDLNHPTHDIGRVAEDLSGGYCTPMDYVHLDPDLEPSRVARMEGWKPAGGHFERISERLILSAAGAGLKSMWRMPEFFSPRDDRYLSYHRDPAR